MTKLINETKNLPMCLRLTIYKYHFLVSNFLYISIITLPIDQLSKLFCPERKKKIPRKKFIQEISPGTCSLYEKCWNNPYKAIVFYMKEKHGTHTMYTFNSKKYHKCQLSPFIWFDATLIDIISNFKNIFNMNVYTIQK